MAFLEFQGVSKRFGRLQAVDNVSLAIEKGEVFSLLGPSGCGKTTLLRICAGFEEPDSGRVFLNGEDITDLPPNRRQVNTVFQNYALFPHLTVRENIAFGLTVARRPRAEIASEVERMLALIQLQGHADKRPDQISGGQKQRVAIARALINRPQVLLLDEPLAALDHKLRQRMLVELDAIHDEVGITFLYVTHDQGEAMSLSDHLAVMNQGRVEQIGRPTELYEAPQSSFVAAFIGDTNFFDGVVQAVTEPDYCQVRVDGLPAVLVFNDKNLEVGDSVHLSVRPEKFGIAFDAPAPAQRLNSIEGVVEDVVYLGSFTKYWVRVNHHRVAVRQQHSRYLLDQRRITWKDRVWLTWHADDGYMLERFRPADEALLDLGEENPKR